LTRRRFLQLGTLALAAPGVRAVAADAPADQERNDLLRRAEASVKAAAARVKGDPDRPVYHVLPPANWNNDPNGPIYYKGHYHLFYQHNPYGDDWGNMHWGHVRSKDLAHWEHLPIALWPSKSKGEEHVFSGCATLTPAGQVMLIYTSIGKRLPEQWAALPEDDDLVRWKKHPANPILTEALHGRVKVHEWRDPFAFEVGGKTYLVLGGNLNASKGGEAVVNVYRADNDERTRWQYLGVLFRHPDAAVKNIECPLFFPLGGKWVLIVSPHGPVQYFVGGLDAAAMRFKPEQRGIVDHGSFYAPNCVAAPDGRRLLWGWVNDFPRGRGWNGCLTVPRVLTLAPDGTLRQEPAPELAKLRAGPPVEQRFQLASTRFVSTHVKGDALEIRADIDPGDAREVGLRLRRSADGSKGVPITFDGKQLDVAGRKAPLTLGPGEKRLRLHVLLDHSVLEVYANGRVCVARVIQADRDALGVEAFARGGTTGESGLFGCALGSAWANRPRNE
jgi:beta-fructofuranosidase